MTLLVSGCFGAIELAMITFSGASPFSEPSGDGPPVIVILSLKY